MNRSRDWMAQAKSDLEHARKSVAMGDFDWACFAAQQAAEKAAKASHLRRGTMVWGSSVLDLLEAVPAAGAVSAELKHSARRLDRHYIQARHPDVCPAGPPRRYYPAFLTRFGRGVRKILASGRVRLPSAQPVGNSVRTADVPGVVMSNKRTPCSGPLYTRRPPALSHIPPDPADEA